MKPDADDLDNVGEMKAWSGPWVTSNFEAQQHEPLSPQLSLFTAASFGLGVVANGWYA